MDPQAALSIAAASDLAIAGAYAWAGTILVLRPYGERTKRAGRTFALWWYGVAVTGILSASLTLLAQARASSNLIDAIDQATMVSFSLALVGFTSYLAFLFSGSYRYDPIILGAYGALAAWSVIDAILDPATGYHVQAWRPIVERAGTGGPSPTLVALLLVVPIVLGTIAYASLLRRVAEPEPRYRIRLVSLALVAWLIGVTVVSIPQAGENAATQLAGRVVVLASAGFILAAYKPPRAIREILGDASAAREGWERRERMGRRVRELV